MTMVPLAARRIARLTVMARADLVKDRLGDGALQA